MARVILGHFYFVLKDFWYPFSASILLQDEPLSKTLLGKDLVAFRNSQGQACVLLDRCCHRGLRLSWGEIVNGNIQCSYHGWRFDGRGQCVLVPSSVKDLKGNPAYQVPRFQTAEQDGYVWVWMGEKETTSTPPSIPEFSTTGWEQGEVDIQCAAIKALESNIDSTHVFFLHASHHKVAVTKEYVPEEMEREIKLTDKGFSTSFLSAENPSVISFELPGTIRLESTSFEGKPALSILMITPVTEKSCCIHFLIQSSKKDAPPLTWIEELPKFFIEDKLVLEEVQKICDRDGESFETHVASDAPGLLIRRILKSVEEGNWEKDQKNWSPRQVIKMKI